VAYPNQQAPKFKYGYKVNAALWGIYLIGIPIILWFSKKYPATEQVQTESEEEHSVVEKEYEIKVLADESVTKEKDIQA
jgi:hypothetical protein